VPRVAREGSDDDSRHASTIPPAPRATPIRSPSDVLQARTGPAPAKTSVRVLAAVTDGWHRLGDATRRLMPESLRAKVEGTSGAVIATGVTVAGVLLLGFGVAVYGTVAPSRSSSETASAAESSEAPAEPAAPAALSPAASVERAPVPEARTAKAPLDEATVLLDLAESLLSQRRDADAVPPLERLIARHPELKNNDRLGRLLLRAAASTDRQAAAQSHALLTGPMGEAGAALLYELSLKSDVREGVRVRVQNWLASKEFERVAPLPVYAAVRLRNAQSCEDKHALLDFAGKAGGKYVLSYLKELEKKKFCAPDDLVHCYPCMRNDTLLADTIAKLESTKEPTK
jgi:hypothetical protein